MVEVAVAVLERPDGAFLLAQRPQGRVYAGWWEFPGGKIERGETPDAALARELEEELGVEVRRAYRWITRLHTYPHARVRLHFFRVARWIGEPRAREHDAMRWQRFDDPMATPMLPANAPVLAALSLPLEYAITTAETMGIGHMLEQIERRFADGLRLVQVRDKGLPAVEREAFARAVVALARSRGARVLVNSDIELARRVGAHGVHLAARDLMAVATRPADMLVAASCHDAAELERAMNLELDFAVLGPIKPTATHPGAPTLGWTQFAHLVHGTSIPVYAIGGLVVKDMEDARSAGAHGIAMIRGAWR
jgi:8-oxo-dGTP diphosphatase